MNKALLGKWIWRFASDMDYTWKSLIAFKYGTDNLGWGSREVRGPLGKGLWKDILKESGWVKDNWKFRVGNGTRIHFWTDHWCGTSALSIFFPSLFGITVNKHVTVADVWDSFAGFGSWNPTFVSAFNDWEFVLVENLLSCLQMERVIDEMDTVLWKGIASARFTVSEAFNPLASGSAILFPAKGI